MGKIIGYVNGLPIEERAGTAHDPSNGQFTSSGSGGGKEKALSSSRLANGASISAKHATAKAHDKYWFTKGGITSHLVGPTHHSLAAYAHDEAAIKHEDAAKDHEASGDHKKAAKHRAKAEEHKEQRKLHRELAAKR